MIRLSEIPEILRRELYRWRYVILAVVAGVVISIFVMNRPPRIPLECECETVRSQFEGRHLPPSMAVKFRREGETEYTIVPFECNGNMLIQYGCNEENPSRCYEESPMGPLDCTTVFGGGRCVTETFMIDGQMVTAGACVP